MFDVLGGFVLAGVAAAVTGGVKDYIADWQAFNKTGEYNLDNDLTTPDFCMMRDPATGKWGLIMITRYDRPWLPGGGGVEFWTFDSAVVEKNRHYWPLRDWRNACTNRKRVGEFVAGSEIAIIEKIDRSLSL